MFHHKPSSLASQGVTLLLIFLAIRFYFILAHFTRSRSHQSGSSFARHAGGGCRNHQWTSRLRRHRLNQIRSRVALALPLAGHWRRCSGRGRSGRSRAGRGRGRPCRDWLSPTLSCKTRSQSPTTDPDGTEPITEAVEPVDEPGPANRRRCLPSRYRGRRDRTAADPAKGSM